MPAEEEERRDRAETSARPEGYPSALDPEEAFKIVGNETRLRILDAIWDAKEEGPPGFAELRERLGRPDSGQFNYHLKKLREAGFIEKVGERYHVRHAGLEVVWAVRSGYLTDRPEIGTFETTGRCYACEEPLHARYADEFFFVECSACDRLHSMGWFPPNALAERTPEEALLTYERVHRANNGLAAEGICPKCNGRVERTLARNWSEAPIRSPYFDPELDGALRIWLVCSQCSAYFTLTPGKAVLDHPAVVGLYREHGIDLGEVPRWELPWTLDESVVEIVSEEPFRLRLTVKCEGDEVVLTLDEAFEVLGVEGTDTGTVVSRD
jgi:DNA-binding transcriptional ArsR family regulator